MRCKDDCRLITSYLLLGWFRGLLEVSKSGGLQSWTDLKGSVNSLYTAEKYNK